MPIEIGSNGSIICTGDGVPLYRMVALKSALKLECVGLKRRGRSAYAIIKEEWGLKGTRESVLEQFTLLCAEASAKVERAQEPAP